MYRQYQNQSSATAAAAAPSSPQPEKCPHPEDKTLFHLVKSGCYDHGQYDFQFAAECKRCSSVFATGESENGGIFLRLIRGELDWFKQRSVTDIDYFFLAWLDEKNIDYREVEKLPGS